MPIRAMGNFLLCSILLGNVLVSILGGSSTWIYISLSLCLGEQHDDHLAGRPDRRWGDYCSNLLHLGHCRLWRNHSTGDIKIPAAIFILFPRLLVYVCQFKLLKLKLKGGSTSRGNFFGSSITSKK